MEAVIQTQFIDVIHFNHNPIQKLYAFLLNYNDSSNLPGAQRVNKNLAAKFCNFFFLNKV